VAENFTLYAQTCDALPDEQMRRLAGDADFSTGTDDDGRARVGHFPFPFPFRVPFAFRVTATEVRCSEDVPQKFRLYRVFDFGRAPRAYVLSGSLRDCCRLEPASYLAAL
jgi:hypothetical protein